MEKILKDLAEIFKKNNATLFVVGGAVRDKQLGKKVFDYDICSKLRLEKVLEILSSTSFLVKVKNPILETAIISFEDCHFEYATLRQENYSKQGERCPVNVSFTDDIELDYLRRDFTCNALYFDILKNVVLDFCQGKKDIENKILKTIKTPNETFSEDSLRILRLIRFSLELNFEIEEQTKVSAIQNSFLLLNCKGQTKLNEITRILSFGCAEKNFNELNLKKFKLMQELNVFNYLFSNKLKKIDFKLRIEDIFKFSLNCNSEKLSLLCFLIDIYLFAKNKTNLSKNELKENILGSLGLQVSKKMQKDFESFINAYEFEKKSENLRFYLFINLKNIDLILSILKFSTNIEDMQLFNNLKNEYDYCKNTKLPLSTKELKISSQDLFTNYPQIEKNKIKKLMEKLFYLVFFEKLENEKVSLLSFAKKELSN